MIFQTNEGHEQKLVQAVGMFGKYRVNFFFDSEQKRGRLHKITYNPFNGTSVR